MTLASLSPCFSVSLKVDSISISEGDSREIANERNFRKVSRSLPLSLSLSLGVRSSAEDKRVSKFPAEQPSAPCVAPFDRDATTIKRIDTTRHRAPHRFRSRRVAQAGCCARGVGYITRRYNARVIYAAWQRAALNGSSDVRRTVHARAGSHLRRIRDL